MSAAEASPQAQVMRLLQGYWVSQTTAALARLGIPDELAGGPRHVDRLAETSGVRPRLLLRLLRAGAELGLVAEGEPDCYGLTELGECLRRDSPLSLREYALGLVAPGHWDPWGRFEEAIRTGEATAPQVLGMKMWDYYAVHTEEGDHFSRAMGELSAMALADVTRVIDSSTAGVVVDVGGAYGVLLAKLLEQNPQSRGILFDLPGVIDKAQLEVSRSPLAGRIDVVGGDFFQQVPGGGDLYVLKSILHDWDDEHATRILATCRQAAAPGSRLLVIEMVVPEPWAPSPVHLIDLNLLVMMGGVERTQSEYAALLVDSGWDLKQATPTGLFSVLEAVAT